MGALPKNCTTDDLITFPKQAATWLDVTVGWARKNQDILPGVIVESNKVKRFHPRTYLDVRLRRNRKV